MVVLLSVIDGACVECAGDFTIDDPAGMDIGRTSLCCGGQRGALLIGIGTIGIGTAGQRRITRHALRQLNCRAERTYVKICSTARAVTSSVCALSCGVDSHITGAAVLVHGTKC
jgi:hypothetical protein